MTMILEIGVPHAFPTFVLFVFCVMRWYDRRGSCNDTSKSRMLLQDEYEELYVGPEFLLEARLA